MQGDWYTRCNLLLLSVCRSEAQTRIAAMTKRHKTDTAQYHMEMQEQERIRARETQLKAFTLARCTDRSELEEQAKKQRGIRGERICAAGTANQEPAELARGLFISLNPKGRTSPLSKGSFTQLSPYK